MNKISAKSLGRISSSMKKINTACFRVLIYDTTWFKVVLLEVPIAAGLVSISKFKNTVIG
jgi:hypothetical protein